MNEKNPNAGRFLRKGYLKAERSLNHLQTIIFSNATPELKLINKASKALYTRAVSSFEIKILMFWMKKVSGLILSLDIDYLALSKIKE